MSLRCHYGHWESSRNDSNMVKGMCFSSLKTITFVEFLIPQSKYTQAIPKLRALYILSSVLSTRDTVSKTEINIVPDRNKRFI